MPHEFVPVAVAIVSGFLVHWTIWIRHEWDEYAVQIVLCFFSIHTLSVFAQVHLFDRSFTSANKSIIGFEALHLTALTISILTYRILFHPLRRIPGPFFAKIWIWWRAYATWRSGARQSVMLQDLHRQYGDVVRVGPNQVSINMPSSVASIHGTGSSYRTMKSAAYLNPANPGSVNAQRDISKHGVHRKKWDRALSPRAASSYIPAITAQIAVLLDRLRSYKGRPMVANLELHLFAFDVMGAIGFGRPEGFNQMASGKLHPAIRDLVAMMSFGVYMMMIPWLHIVTAPFPAMGIIYKPDEEFRVFAEEVLKEKRQVTARQSDSKDPTDIVSYLMQTRGSDDMTLSQSQLISDALILSIAGSDNPTSACVHSVFHLARHSGVQDKLFEEIQTVVSPESDTLEWPKLAKLQYLDAFINEVLRLHPPAPSALNRTVMSDGLQLEDGTYIPPGTDVSNPVYTLQRDERSFPHAADFIPERWLKADANSQSAVHLGPRPDLLIDRRAFMPFLAGPYGCAGKFVAYMELKLFLASIVKTFKVSFRDDANLTEVDRNVNENWKDFTTTQPALIEVRFQERAK